MATATATATATAAANGGALTSPETATMCAIAAACGAVLWNTMLREGGSIMPSMALSGIAFAATYCLIVWSKASLVKAGLKGVDMSKRVRYEIPECAGAICAVVYLLIIIVLIPFAFYKDIVAATSGGGNRDVVEQVEHVNMGRFLHKFPHSKLSSYLSAVMSLQSIALLGIGDDLFDIRWRNKIGLPVIAAIPLLTVYFVDFGVTSVTVPIPLRSLLGAELVHLGWFYYVYMAMLAIFCPNSINILAGINGIEVMQSIVIALLICLNDLLYLSTAYPHPATDSHLFSLSFLLPFLGVSLALWWHNAYPARVFVGDTYCYFAGMVFVVVSILGHFSKTLVLLFIPQALNFLYSMPQLFKWIPCPRHRLPRYNAARDHLEPSVTLWSAHKQPHWSAALWLRPLAKMRLLKVVYAKDDAGREIFLETSNLTILNWWLVVRGPMHERRLAWELTGLQVVVGLLGLLVRHMLGSYMYNKDNWSFSSSTPV